MQYTNKAYLLTGGNTGDRYAYLRHAVNLINEHCGRVSMVSPVYETAAWGITDQAPFLNQALELETNMEAGELMLKLLHIEEQLGRRRGEKYGPRIIDIDILLFNDEQHNTPELTVPHAEMQNRRFALLPLAAIAPAKIHPALKKSISRLLEECTDALEVREVNGE